MSSLARSTTKQTVYSRRDLARQRWAARWRQTRGAWSIYAENRIAVLGLIIIVLFALVPFVYAILRSDAWQGRVYDPITGFDINYAPHPSPPSWIPADALPLDSMHRFSASRPSFDHLLGTDTVGRDVLSVLMASTVNSFIVGMTAALVTAVVGITLAAVAAYHRGATDLILTHISDAFLLIPAPIFMIAVGAFLRAQNTTIFEIFYERVTGSGISDVAEAIIQPLEFGLVYGIIAGAGGATIVLRSHGLKVMNYSFVEASRVAGGGARQIIWHHLVPHMVPLAAIYMMVTVTGAVIADGFLSFTGYNPNPLSWGTMIYNAFVYRSVNATIPWNALLAPAIAISLFAAAFYMVSRGIHQVVEPRLRDEFEGRG